MVDLVGVYHLHFSGLNGFIKSNISDIKEQKKTLQIHFSLTDESGRPPASNKGDLRSTIWWRQYHQPALLAFPRYSGY